ncbi:hypothetical protein OMR07_07180 [Methylobacterium organophilum]|nr:hypothetical protein [Methylobacterium organophilum]
MFIDEVYGVASEKCSDDYGGLNMEWRRSRIGRRGVIEHETASVSMFCCPKAEQQKPAHPRRSQVRVAAGCRVRQDGLGSGRSSRNDDLAISARCVGLKLDGCAA